MHVENDGGLLDRNHIGLVFDSPSLPKDHSRRVAHDFSCAVSAR